MANINMIAVMEILELPMDKVQPLLDKLNNDVRNAQLLLAKFKLLVKKQRRTLAKKYHPDVYKDSGERMKRINNVVDLILVSKIMLPQPQVVVRYSSAAYYSYNYYGGKSTATSTW